jgi:hypothetical protein
MNIDESKWLAMFRLGIIFFNQNRQYDALAIFELLVNVYPDARIYKEYEMRIIKAIAEEFGAEAAKEKFHLKKATSFGKRLRVADVISSLNDPDLIDLCIFDSDQDERPEYLLAKANACIQVDIDRWVNLTNQYLSHFDLSPIAVDSVSASDLQPLFFKLAGKKLPKVSGPLISICMTCYNGAKYIEIAVNSLLNQTYANFELFIVDDFSDDNSVEIIHDLARRDSRIRVIENEVGKGTYASRNHVFSVAKGEFFAVHDSDDFALPERLALQVKWLMKHPTRVALLAEWIRISIDGRFEYKTGWEGAYQHQAHATLVVRTNEIRDRLGYWDSVFFGADTEMIFRIRKIFGDQGVGMLKMPMTLALSHGESLTQHPVIGINKGINKRSSDVRVEYRKSWESWHDGFSSNTDGYVDFPQLTRPFTVPDVMLGALRNANQ